MKAMPSVFIGLVLPFAGVAGAIPFIADTDAAVAGIPLLFAWIFAWFPLTSACLWFCWWRYDRHRYAAEGSSPEPGDVPS
jgi:hypothetical protein